MGEEKRIRLLRADEIECRAASVSGKGVSLLLYKDARVDQNILDETFGICGWKREHTLLGDAISCTVSIRDENGEWVGKQDVGTPSYAEPVKGAASDAFKRACFNIGVGRELHTAPFIWIPSGKTEIAAEGNRYIVKDRFKVTAIAYDEHRAICRLRIVNQKGWEVFSYSAGGEAAMQADAGNKVNGEKRENANKEIVNTMQKNVKGQTANEMPVDAKGQTARKVQADTKEQHEKNAGKAAAKDTYIGAAQQRKLRRELARTGVSEEAVCARYQVGSLGELTQTLYERALEALSKTGDAAA